MAAPEQKLEHCNTSRPKNRIALTITHYAIGYRQPMAGLRAWTVEKSVNWSQNLYLSGNFNQVLYSQKKWES